MSLWLSLRAFILPICCQKSVSSLIISEISHWKLPNYVLFVANMQQPHIQLNERKNSTSKEPNHFLLSFVTELIH